MLLYEKKMDTYSLIMRFDVPVIDIIKVYVFFSCLEFFSQATYDKIYFDRITREIYEITQK